MNTLLFSTVKRCMVIALLSLLALIEVNSQTPGTLTFNITTTSSGGYSPKHLIAIWIENNSGTFVKTKLKQSSSGNLDHLAIWTGKSGGNVVDATTGATLTSHGALTVIWNGTDINGNIVSDGSYNVVVEMAWASNLSTGKTSTTYSFTKGTSAYHSTPTASTNFSNISLDWAPTALSVKNLDKSLPVNLYPNPATSNLFIDFKQPVTNGIIEIINATGKVLYSEPFQSINGVKNISLVKFPAGVYFVNIRYADKNLNYRIVRKK